MRGGGNETGRPVGSLDTNLQWPVERAHAGVTERWMDGTGGRRDGKIEKKMTRWRPSMNDFQRFYPSHFFFTSFSLLRICSVLDLGVSLLGGVCHFPSCSSFSLSLHSSVTGKPTNEIDLGPNYLPYSLYKCVLKKTQDNNERRKYLQWKAIVEALIRHTYSNER